MIKTLTAEYKEQVIDLHCKILHWSINARLGREHISRLYDTLLEDPHVFGFVDVDEDGRLLSFITLSSAPFETRARVFKIYRTKQLFKIVLQSFLKPLDFIDLFENKFIIPGLMRKLDPRVEIFTWVADIDTLAGRVSGVRIMQHAVADAKEKDLFPLFAQVAKYDDNPNKFHKSAGNQLVNTLTRNNLYLIDQD